MEIPRSSAKMLPSSRPTRTAHSGKWKTAPGAHYPGDMCLSRAIAKTWQLHSAASEGSSLPTKTKHTGSFSETSVTVQGECIMEDSGTFELPLNGSLDEDEAVEVDRDIKHDEIISGCRGPPMVAKYAGRAERFVDGLGLCSPGRWHPAFRSQNMDHEKLKFAKVWWTIFAILK